MWFRLTTTASFVASCLWVLALAGCDSESRLADEVPRPTAQSGTSTLVDSPDKRDERDLSDAGDVSTQGNLSDDAYGGSRAELDDLLTLARASFERLETSLDDYTATFVKQERGDDGSLGAETKIEIRTQTRLRNETNDAPVRLFLKFIEPEGVAGRKVVWASDLNDGNMAVHEAGFLLNLKTIWLRPDGPMAMRGQRYPVWEIGLVKLMEKLIERGEQLRGGPVDVNSESIQFDGRTMQRSVIDVGSPGDGPDDFARAEIILDLERNLVVAFQSFRKRSNSEVADKMDSSDRKLLIERYEYRDIKTNQGLGDDDFDVTNPNLGFPAF